MFIFYGLAILIGCIELYISKILKLTDKKIILFKEFKKYTDSSEVIKIRLRYCKILKVVGLFSVGSGIFSILLKSIFIKFEFLAIIPIFLSGLVLSLLLLLVAMFVITNINKSTVDRNTKIITYIVLIIIFIGPYFDNIVFCAKNLYGVVFTTSIKPNEEFILFKCKTDKHKEKVYISINDIYKDKNNDIILDVNLRYRGKDSINLYGKNGFDELSGFYAEAVDIEDKSNSKGFYVDISNETISEYNSNIKKLSSMMSNGDTMNVKAPILTKGSNIEDFDISELKFKIDKSYSGSHHGVGSFKYINLEK